MQRPLTAVVALKNDLLILSCFRMKTESPFVRPARPLTEAMPVPATPIRGRLVRDYSPRSVYEPMSARKIRNGSKITRRLRSQTM